MPTSVAMDVRYRVSCNCFRGWKPGSLEPISGIRQPLGEIDRHKTARPPGQGMDRLTGPDGQNLADLHSNNAVDDYVIVNGELVVRDSIVLKDVHPGQPIRFPVADKPRFKPLSLEGWQDRFLVAPAGFHGLDGDHIH